MSYTDDVKAVGNFLDYTLGLIRAFDNRRENEYRDLTHRLMDELVIRRTLDEQLRECDGEQTCRNCGRRSGYTCLEVSNPLECVLEGYRYWEEKDD